MREIGCGNGGCIRLESRGTGGHGGGEALVGGAVDGEARVEGVIVVVLLDVVATEAFDVEQRAVQELQLLPRVVGA